MASLAPEVAAPYWPLAPIVAFIIGMVVYGALLLALFWQGQKLRLRYALMNFLVQIEILLFLVVFLYLLNGMKIFPDWAFLSAGFILSLYAGALAIFYAASYWRSPMKAASRRDFVEGQLRLTLPFAAPYLMLALLSDLLSPWLTLDLDAPSTALVSFLFFVAFMALMMVSVPPLIVGAWKCRPLPEGPIREGLEEICCRGHFRCREILSWTILKHAATAAILGVFPKYRYVMFTELMLRELSPKALQAVLAHEIGHSRHYHLLLYPFILFGGLVLAGIFGGMITPALGHWLERNDMPTLLPLASLLPYAIILALYFRLVFGYFSRLFERQADLSVFSLGIQPSEMVEALHTVAVLGGHIHDQPSWHHFSIRQRIETLEEAERHPERVAAHSQRVKRAVISYAAMLGMGLVLITAPSFPDTSGFKQVNEWMEKGAVKVDGWLNRST